jgi:hypothetical protein
VPLVISGGLPTGLFYTRLRVSGFQHIARGIADLPILFTDGHHWCLIGTLPNHGGCIGLRSKGRLLFDVLKIVCNAVNLILPLNDRDGSFHALHRP